MSVGPLLSAADFFAGAQPTLRGAGLVLRPWRADDAPAAARAYTDPAIRHWHTRVLDAAEAPAWIDWAFRRPGRASPRARARGRQLAVLPGRVAGRIRLEGVKRSALRHADGWHDMHLHARLADD